MAAMPASLMCCGVAKCGSPAPKSTTSMPCARSLSASATTAVVAEGSMRLIRSVSFRASLVAVVMPSLSFSCLLFSFLFSSTQNFDHARVPQLVGGVKLFAQLLLHHFRDQSLHRTAGLRHFAHQARADVGV